MMGVAKSILNLPKNHQNKQSKHNIESTWRILLDQMKNEVTKVLGLAQDASNNPLMMMVYRC